MFQTVTLWRQIALSLILNWILGPFVSYTKWLALMSDHAGCRLGHITGSTNVSRGSDHGRPRPVSMPTDNCQAERI
jgi:hypothetical protein